MSITYADSGVDREKGDLFVQRIEKMVRSTYHKAVKSGVGGFASLYEIGKGRYLAAGTDGVGTKLKVAQLLGVHDTVGIDLVAMCVNDVVCTGARPLFFLDYIGCGQLDLAVTEGIVKGIVDGCKQAGVALVGGETAEMPGMYDEGEYDLAGFSVGEVSKKDLLDGSKLKAGDELVGLASSGLHSNGFSLVRKLLRAEEEELLKMALTPTRIYVKNALAALAAKKFGIRGFAHITGSGFYNIPRINSKFRYVVTNLPEPPAIFPVLQERALLESQEMYSTFNMGVGFVIACQKGKAEALVKFMNKKGERAFPLGHVEKGKGETVVRAGGLDFELK
ncbi:MAG TPA: phosphoribosylformylglycinamidine cyclo-ligase [Bdellovibrionota bacterium]|jgi:phosphoribosylformylglycinamidine cyclo-ligase